MTIDTAPLTELLGRWREGDKAAENQLFEAIYPIMCAQAQANLSHMSGRDLTLCATALANEAYEKLNRQKSVQWQNRDHFLAIAATVVRRVLMDYLRYRGAGKRGGGKQHVELLDDLDCPQPDTGYMNCQLPDTDQQVDLVELDQLLDQLGAADPEMLRTVELRIFAGLNIEEIARVCQVSESTVGRRWRFARAWLKQRIADEDTDGDGTT